MKYREIHLLEFAPTRTQFDKILKDPTIMMGFEVELITNTEKHHRDPPPAYNSMAFRELERHIGHRAANRIREAYHEWMVEQTDDILADMWSDQKDHYIKQWCIDNDYLEAEEEDEDIIENVTHEHQKEAYADFTEENRDEALGDVGDIDDYIDNEFSSTTDMMDHFNIEYEQEDEDYYDEPDEDQVYAELADSLYHVVGQRVAVGYSRGDNDWRIVEDSSIEGDNIGAEIVSSVYQLNDGLDMLDKIFDWMKDNGHSTNHSTGLHVSFSIEGKEDEDDYDFLKMMVLFDENYTANLFRRLNESFCEQMRKTLYRGMHEGDKNPFHDETFRSSRSINTITSSLKKIGSSLPGALGRTKYRTFRHRNNGVVEFRSMGGEDYEDRFPLIRNRIVNMAYLMKVGSDPDLMAREYVQGIYKMLMSRKYSQPKLGSGAGHVEVPPSMNSWAPIFTKRPDLMSMASIYPAQFVKTISETLISQLARPQLNQLRFYIIRNKITADIFHRVVNGADLVDKDKVYNQIANLMRWPLAVPGDERQQTLPYARSGGEKTPAPKETERPDPYIWNQPEMQDIRTWTYGRTD